LYVDVNLSLIKMSLNLKIFGVRKILFYCGRSEYTSAAVNKNSKYHTMIPAFWLLPFVTSLNLTFGSLISFRRLCICQYIVASLYHLIETTRKTNDYSAYVQYLATPENNTHDKGVGSGTFVPQIFGDFDFWAKALGIIA